MPLLFSPLSEGILEGPFKPYPRSAFIMLHSGKDVSGLEENIDSVACNCLSQMRHIARKASRQSGTKDYLEKIIQIIRGCGFGIAFFSEFTPASTLANIFFEIGLCGVLGKPVILVKSARAKPPSDFVRTEWITFQNGDKRKLRRDLEKAIRSIRELATYYEDLGDLALEADEMDLELAFERYRQAILIGNKQTVRQKIRNILLTLKDDRKPADFLRASKSRLRKSIQEFDTLLPKTRVPSK
jgi:hypothetical protein